MNLYVDDNTCKALLVTLLRKAGHQVTAPADVGTAAVSDARHLLHAVTHSLLVLTKDHNDFEDLHLVVQATLGRHPGILAVRLDNDASRDMKDRDIVRAIGNLERAGVPLSNEFHILNHWRQRQAQSNVARTESFAEVEIVEAVRCPRLACRGGA